VQLERLIETEQRNDALVRHAAAEAEAIVRAARDGAQRREADLAAELRQLVAANAAAITADGERRQTTIAATAREEAAGYRAVTDAQIAAVARVLIDDLVTGGGIG
jgi:vacuolar-type H+-ATPase subunit H